MRPWRPAGPTGTGARDVLHRLREGDEFAFSDLVADEFGTDHHRMLIAGGRLANALPRAIEAMSEPMVSHDCVAFWMLSEAVRRERKVVQSGQGADEVLGGYSWSQEVGDATGSRRHAYAAGVLRPRRRGVRALLADAPDEDVSMAFARAWFERWERRRPWTGRCVSTRR